jgi:hypothetical protein
VKAQWLTGSRLSAGCAWPPQQRLDDQLAVDGAGNRLTHPRVLQQRIAQVEAEVLNLRSRRVFDNQIRPRGQHRQRIHGQGIDGHVARAFFQLQRLGDRVRHHAKAHPLNLRRAGPTQRIALDHHVLIDLLADKAKRPRAHRMPPELAPAAFGNNAECARRKIGQQKIVRVLQMENNRPRIASLDCIHRGIGGGLGRNHRARADRIHRPRHIARRQRAAVVEAHAMSADERPASAAPAAPSSRPAPA